MREVAIVGAGELGGLVAYALARQHTAAIVRLIDDNGRVAEGKALDINQASPVEGFATAVSASTDLSNAAGADFVVIADRAAGQGRTGSQDWRGDDAVSLIRRLNSVAPRARFLCASASHREVVERSIREIRTGRSRILGTAAEAFAAAATAIVALEMDVSPRDVALSVLGVPPRQIVVGWEHASVAGFSITGMIGEPTRRMLTQRISALWPVGPYAQAAAVAKVLDVLSGRSRRPVTCFVGPDDQAGIRTRAAALPVKLGASGLIEVMVPVLSAVERVALDNAMLL
jgi:malate dehydrogenase